MRLIRSCGSSAPRATTGCTVPAATPGRRCSRATSRRARRRYALLRRGGRRFPTCTGPAGQQRDEGELVPREAIGEIIALRAQGRALRSFCSRPPAVRPARLALAAEPEPPRGRSCERPLSAGIPDPAGIRRVSLVRPGGVDQSLQIEAGPPGELELGQGIVHPVRMVAAASNGVCKTGVRTAGGEPRQRPSLLPRLRPSGWLLAGR